MNRFLRRIFRRENQQGFSLVETVLSLGIISFGFLTLAPLLALGLKESRLARENRITAQIASSLIEQARQAPLPTGPLYFDSGCNPVSTAQACYVVRESMTSFAPGATGSGPLTRLTLRVAPLGLAGTGRTYVAAYPTPP